MKKTKKTMLTAAVLAAAAAGLAGCTNLPGGEQENVYGPPPEYDSSVTESIDEKNSSDKSADDVSSKYDPADDNVQDVYGPPPDDDSSIADEDSSYAPDTEPIQVEYGPEYDEDDSSDEVIDFKASEEIQQLVYGPPEMFE